LAHPPITQTPTEIRGRQCGSSFVLSQRLRGDMSWD
jgi:hypothetical protein